MGDRRQTGIETQKAQRIAYPVRKRLFTLKEAAEYLGRPVWGMRELIWSHVIPVVKQAGGRKIFVDIFDLDKYVDKNKAVYN